MDLIKILIYAYVAFFIYAGINHFRYPSFYDNIVPSYIPFPNFTHKLAGILEIIIPLFLLTKYRSTAALIMVIFILLLYLGNLHVWVNNLSYGKTFYSNLQHTVRLFLQILLIYLTYIIYKYG